VLVKLLENADEDEMVLKNVVGALCECLKFKHNRDVLRRVDGIPYLVNLLNYTFPPLLENVPMVLRECAEDESSMRIIENLDGVRLIWSLLKNDSPKVDPTKNKQTHNDYAITGSSQRRMVSGTLHKKRHRLR
jgi:hypothetical protein